MDHSVHGLRTVYIYHGHSRVISGLSDCSILRGDDGADGFNYFKQFSVCCFVGRAQRTYYYSASPFLLIGVLCSLLFISLLVGGMIQKVLGGFS